MKSKHIGKLNFREDILTEEIVKLYFKNKLSCQQIADKLNCTSTLIRERLRNSNHELRTASEAHKLHPAKYWLGKNCPNASSEGHIKAMKEWWQENKNKEQGINIVSNLNQKGNFGEKNAFFGKKHTEETKKIIREKTPKYFGENNPFYNKKHTEETRKIIREARALQIFPVKDTKIEIKVQEFLKQLNIEFLTHNYIEDIEHGYQCDIQINPQPNFMAERKTILELDGDYWHANPEFFPIEKLTERQKKQIEKDACRNEELREAGFEVIRLWETDINKMSLEDFKNILNKNLNKLKEILK